MATRRTILKATQTSRSPIRVSGDLDRPGGEQVKRAVDEALAEGRLDLTVDLDGVRTLDSAGLAALIVSLRRARERGGDVRVVANAAHIRKVLEITALSRVFKLQPAADKAA